MKLRGIHFGSAWLGSGALGFFGEGYRFHAMYRMILGDLFCPEKFTFVAKTTTVDSRLGKQYEEEGNMELRSDFTPKDLFPDCISCDPVDFINGEMLNAVGLAGPGAQPLFLRHEWQTRRAPFFLSFMTTKKDDEARAEISEFKRLLALHLDDFRAAVGLQINLSCPNAHVDLEKAAQDACVALDEFATLGIPLVPKFSVLTPVEVVKMVAEHPACDAIQISNTIPYGKHNGLIWASVSPLAQYGGGGLSGAQLLPLVCEWVAEARKVGIIKPINAGGGVLCSEDVDRLAYAGANGISVATAVAIRPWRLRSILGRAYDVFSTSVR